MTIPGTNLHTVAEVNDLIRAKDQEIALIENNYRTLTNAAWKSSSAGQKWFADWSNLKNRYTAAKSGLTVGEVAKAITLPFMYAAPDSLSSDEDRYQNILEALENHTGTFFNNAQEGVVLPGGYQDLYNRLSTVSPSLTGQDKSIGRLIQPRKDSDASEQLLKNLAKFDPLGDKKARAEWEKWAVGISFCAASIFAVVAAKEVFGPFNIGRKILPQSARRQPASPDEVWAAYEQHATNNSGVHK